MKHHIAQLNIARFRLPAEHEANADFMNQLDAVNALAEQQPGFVWRLVGDGADNATGLRPFEDPNIIVNLTVWESIEHLAQFAYKVPEHLAVMRRRKEWFEPIQPYLVLWWVPVGTIPTAFEAQKRLELLARNGPSPEAFTFRAPFPAPDGASVKPITDECV